jgi:hypothetical protein
MEMMRTKPDMNAWPMQSVRPLHEWILSMDVGQSIDPSAVCALEHRVTGNGKFTADETNRVIREQRVESFHVRHLERLPLGTPYPTQIQHVANLLGREPLTDATLVIDFTGVGRPVFDMFDRAGLRPHGVLITAGNEVSQQSARIFHVPKQHLISQLEARLHSGELKIAANIADAGALAEELKDFARKVSESGRVTFNARSGAHDDLVLAVAIALFTALNRTRWESTELRW